MTLATRRGSRGWDPFQELHDMMDRMNRGFGGGGLARSNDQLTGFDWSPTVNVSESAKAYVIKAELPEVKREDVHVQLDNGMLTISGERRHEKEEDDEKHHRVESAYGSFMRSFTLPEDAHADKIDASFENGMLKIKIPKQEAPVAKSRRISVS